MESKSVRNAIIALIILVVGCWFLFRIGKAYLPSSGPIDLTSMLTAAESMINLFLIAIIVLIIILIPVWIAKKREEIKTKQDNENSDDYHDYHEIKEQK